MLSGTEVTYDRGDTTDHAGHSLAFGVVRNRPVDSNMEMRIDASREDQLSASIDMLLGVRGIDFVIDRDYLAVARSHIGSYRAEVRKNQSPTGNRQIILSH